MSLFDTLSQTGLDHFISTHFLAIVGCVQCLSFFLKHFYWDILLYNVELVSIVQKSDQLYMYMYHIFLGFPSHVGHHRALSKVP